MLIEFRIEKSIIVFRHRFFELARVSGVFLLDFLKCLKTYWFFNIKKYDFLRVSSRCLVFFCEKSTLWWFLRIIVEPIWWRKCIILLHFSKKRKAGAWDSWKFRKFTSTTPTHLSVDRHHSQAKSLFLMLTTLGVPWPSLDLPWSSLGAPLRFPGSLP